MTKLVFKETEFQEVCKRLNKVLSQLAEIYKCTNVELANFNSYSKRMNKNFYYKKHNINSNDQTKCEVNVQCKICPEKQLKQRVKCENLNKNYKSRNIDTDSCSQKTNIKDHVNNSLKPSLPSMKRNKYNDHFKKASKYNDECVSNEQLKTVINSINQKFMAIFDAVNKDEPKTCDCSVHHGFCLTNAQKNFQKKLKDITHQFWFDFDANNNI